MDDTLEIFQFLQQSASAGEAVALVTVTDVTGGSTRNPGAHMGVAANGDFRGSLSGGCIEAEVVNQALAAMETGKPRALRYGQGSPFFDIRLPCGGSVDVLITPISDPDPLNAIAKTLAGRQPVGFTLFRDEGGIALALARDGAHAAWDDAGFSVNHPPPLKLCILGHGASVEALFNLAQASAIECTVLTPDRDIIEKLAARGQQAIELKSLDQAPPFDVDRWTACIFLFHDHEWDAVLIPRILEQNPFFIGAMGSRKTAAARRDYLIAAGVDPTQVERLHGPIGLVPSSRNPRMLALSVLTQAASEYDQMIRPTG